MTDDTPKPQSRRQRRKLVAEAIGKIDRRRRPRGLTSRVKAAIDAIVFDRCSRQEACERAGLTERALYLALAKVEVATYWNGQIEVLRRGERAKNLHRLTDIRDQNSNPAAAVKAVQVLEAVPDDVRRAPGAIQPGLVIIVNSPAGSQQIGSKPVIDVTPSRQPRGLTEMASAKPNRQVIESAEE
jgi:hypothetical protein